MAPRLILASASPQRKALLEAVGARFEVRPSGAVELRRGDPAEVVVENARAKAESIAAGLAGEHLVLGVDTDVALDGKLLGKPADDAGARGHLKALSGREHEVLSGVAVCRNGAVTTGIERSTVLFRDLDSATVEAYLRTGEWRDRAGGYAVQGYGSSLVERVEGDLSNVIGLPLRLLAEILPEAFASD